MDSINKSNGEKVQQILRERKFDIPVTIDEDNRIDDGVVKNEIPTQFIGAANKDIFE